MAIRYSLSTRGFYHDGIHDPSSIPQDAVPVSQAEFDELMRLQGQGYAIQPVNGRPQAVEPQGAPDDPTAAGMNALDFRRRFTAVERAKITSFANEKNNNGDPTLQVFLDDLAAAGTVYLSDPEIVQGVEYCAAMGLITPRRADAILGR